jgi:predicted outer membrane repeat protein
MYKIKGQSFNVRKIISKFIDNSAIKGGAIKASNSQI